MKRSLGSSDSLGALMSICPTTTDDHNHNHVYSSEFQTMLEGLDEEGCVEESSSGHIPAEKKRRLKVEQVKALEKNFEVENKLEPERKVKLAQELGLQPRQVAVWFQNRRARWKTKQLERDYGVLKANYDQLKHNYENIKGENDALLKEIHDLKAKLNDENGESNVIVAKEEATVSENEKKEVLFNTATKSDDGAIEINFESINNGVLMGASIFTDSKDGSSDSDSSAVLNEENQNHSPKASNSSSSAVVVDQYNQSPQHFLISSSNGGCFQFSDQLKSSILEEADHKAYQPQFVKIEEHNFFSGEDSCNNFFCDDQAPTLQWYNSDDWN